MLGRVVLVVEEPKGRVVGAPREVGERRGLVSLVVLVLMVLALVVVLGVEDGLIVEISYADFSIRRRRERTWRRTRRRWRWCSWSTRRYKDAKETSGRGALLWQSWNLRGRGGAAGRRAIKKS